MKIDDPPAIWTRDISFANVPLFGHYPVKDGRPAWHLEIFERNEVSDRASVRRIPSPVILRQIG